MGRSPVSRARSLNASKPLTGMYISPRTSRVCGTSAPVSRRGTEGMAYTLAVTSSPASPLPRVAARTRAPERYSRLTATPSIFGSQK